MVYIKQIINSHQQKHENNERAENKIVERFGKIFRADKNKQHKEVDKKNCFLPANGIEIKLPCYGNQNKPDITEQKSENEKQRINDRTLPLENVND